MKLKGGTYSTCPDLGSVPRPLKPQEVKEIAMQLLDKTNKRVKRCGQIFL